MPFRLTSSLGVQGNSFFQAHHWELNADYRGCIPADGDFFVGASRRHRRPRCNHPVGRGSGSTSIRSALGLTYAATDRIRVSIAAPFQTGRVSFIQEDNMRHSERVTDLGDVIVTGGAWLFNPRIGPGGNVMLGLGLKISTGSHRDRVTLTSPRPARRSGGRSVHPDRGRRLGNPHAVAGIPTVFPGAFAYLYGFLSAESQSSGPRLQIGRPIGLPGDPARGDAVLPFGARCLQRAGGVSYAVAPQWGFPPVSAGGSTAFRSRTWSAGATPTSGGRDTASSSIPGST